MWEKMREKNGKEGVERPSLCQCRISVPAEGRMLRGECASSRGGWALDVGGRDACDTRWRGGVGRRIHLEEVSEGDIWVQDPERR